jgi:hypothetical protein
MSKAKKKAPAKKTTKAKAAPKKKSPAKAAAPKKVATYTPPPITGMGWAPFRYPLQ